YIDEEKTAALRAAAEDEILPYFYVSYTDTILLREKAEEMYELYSGTMDKEKEQILLNSSNPESYVVMRSGIKENGESIAAIAKDCILHFCYNGVFSQDEIALVISEKKQSLMMETVPGFGYTFESGVIDTKDVITEQSLRSDIYQWIINNYTDLKFNEVQLIADICQLMIYPNVHYDEVYTEAMREIRKNSVEPVVVTVEKGDYILKTDTLVTAEQLRTLEILNSKRSFSLSILSVLPQMVVAGFVLVFWFWYSVGCIAYDYRKAQYTLITITMMALSMFGGFLMTWFLINKNLRYIDGFMPFLLVSMIGTSITSRRTYGTATSLALIALYCMWPTADSMSFFYLVACCCASVMTIKTNTGRFQTILIALKTVVYLVGLTIIFGLLTTKDFTDILINSLAISVNVIVSFVVYAILLPVLENAFNIPTKQRLNELAYTDNAILNQLSQVAQGTYNHVKNVSELAFAAATSIGANAELALVGARYHDIGKMVHPEYFVENQNGKNAHDNISSLLSRSVIKSHVRLGTEKGKEIGLPQEILDIIDEHHGNDIIRYFYNEAMKNA
ncbi:MAG: HDIG domain-containing protein, partial [Spirochaetales bacterium]|nr:HDIG domain-containing protein [Candidatus Physcosoma equi]